MTEDQAKKLKPGDKVVCINSDEPSWPVTLGKIYVIGGYYYKENDTYVNIEEDDKGRPDGYPPDIFESATPLLNEQKLRKKLGLL